MSAILAVCGLEFRMGLRNRWVLLATLILLLFAAILVAIGSVPGADAKSDSVSLLVASLATLSVYILPLLALLLSFDSIAGEIDRGTLQLTLATPISRSQLVLGKFLGHLLVLSIAVTLGYGSAGGLAFFTGEAETAHSVLMIIRLILTSVLLGAAFIGIGLAASASVRQTGTAAALAIGIWLVSVVLYDLALLGGLVLSPDGYFARTLMPYFLLLNPADAFRVFNMHMLDLAGGSATGLGGGGESLPYPAQLSILSPLAVAVAGLLFSVFALRRLDP